MELVVLKHTGENTQHKVNLVDSIFNVETSDHAIYLDTKRYLTNQRQGTHKARERSEIVGSTRKIKRQKGTGTARAGSIKSPIFRGGGRVFGPVPRDYGFKLNQKVKQVARRSALTYKAKEDAITVLEDFALENPRTKEYVKMLNSLSLSIYKTLFIIAGNDRNMFLASRNLKYAKLATVDNVSTYDILNAQHLIISEKAVSELEKKLTDHKDGDS